MPTANRRSWVARAIKYFQTQDYPNKELVILDDGADSVADLVPDDPQMHYVRVTRKVTLGAKRNQCVEASRGDLIMHWDDDDWMASHRISYQIESLLREDAEVCGLRRMLFYELATGRTWLYQYPPNQRPWLAGGSLLYTRDFWRRAPFPEIQVASDTRFIYNQKLERAVVLDDYNFYVAMIHPGNTSPKNHRGSYWSPWEGDIRAVIGEDFPFYNPQRRPDVAAAPARVTRAARTTARRHAGTSRTVGVAVAGDAEATKAASEHAVESQKLSAVRYDDLHARPLVSCILTTRDRPGFVRQAIRCFLRQAYENAELIVVDDGALSVAALCAGLYRVRYVRLGEPASVAQKLNTGIAHARGEIVQRFNEGDYYHPDFLLRAALHFDPTGEGQPALVAWERHLVLLHGESHVRLSSSDGFADATLSLRRRFWEGANFCDAPGGRACIDADFDARIVKVRAPEMYIEARHAPRPFSQNGQSKNQSSEQLAELPVYHRPLAELVEPIDLAFYQSLAKEVF